MFFKCQTKLLMLIDRIVNALFRKGATFAAAVFASDELVFDVFNEHHMILKFGVNGLWKPKPLLYQADPFLFVKGKDLFLFYELQNWDDPGCIAMVKTSDLIHWSNPQIVLRESFHLSFPFVFEFDGTIYMIPESQEANSIRLYKANADLKCFSYVRTLLKNERTQGVYFNFNDNHVFYKEGKFYLFTSYQKDWMYYQELYITDNLLNGTFVKHPKSPICVSNEYGRNGGSIINFKGKLLRVTQDCHKDYGDNISLMEITQIDESHYEEELFRHNVFPHNSIFIDGGHQLNIVQFNDKYIYATDYKTNKWTWYQSYVSVMKKLGLHNRKSLDAT